MLYFQEEKQIQVDTLIAQPMGALITQSCSVTTGLLLVSLWGQVFTCEKQIIDLPCVMARFLSTRTSASNQGLNKQEISLNVYCNANISPFFYERAISLCWVNWKNNL